MLANFLSKSKPINFIVLLSLFFCAFIISIYNRFFVDTFSFNNVLKSVVIFGLFLAVFFFYNFIVSKNRLTFDNSYSYFLFTLFLSFLLSTLIEYKTMILTLLHLFFLRKTYSLKSTKQVLQKLFDAGFWLGISFLIEPVLSIYFILIYTGIYLHLKITIHTLLTPVLGFITPLIVYFTYCFWFDITEDFLQLFYFNTINSIFIYAENNIIWFVSIIMVVTLLSIFIKSPKALSVNNSFKKNWILLILNAVIALIFALIIPIKNGSEIVYLLFPTSVIIANGLEVLKSNLVKNILISLVLISVIMHTVFL
ncbi:MAG: DUF6427 family protein [Polaribacter sp.]|uniref:DUF6427 family protein n=1 Tax=Polaribacter sp. TaxID=1920175 RepID=UPI002F35D655